METKGKFLFFFQVAWSVCTADLADKDLTKVCSSLCPGQMSNSSFVAEECTHGLVIIDKCCVNTSSPVHSASDVVGIDLSGCNLTQINKSLLPFHNVVKIDLQGNPLSQREVKTDSFYGLSVLEYLSLPAGLHCPGNSSAWLASNYSNNATVCVGQIDQCFYDNFTCPESSYCVPRGPGLKDCLCKSGHFGYKCLRSGHFNTEAFVLGLCGTTVALSAFLWVTQRRHVNGKKRA